MRLASSECLGKIGALDPSYLPNNIIKEGTYTHKLDYSFKRDLSLIIFT